MSRILCAGLILLLAIEHPACQESASNEQLQPAVTWSVVADYRTREHRDWRTPTLLQYGIGLHEAHPEFTADEILDRMRGLEALSTGAYSDQYADLLKDTVALIPGVGEVGSKGIALLTGIGRAYGDFQSRPTEEDYYKAYADHPLIWVAIHDKSQHDKIIYAVSEKWLGSRLAIPPPGNNSAAILSTAPAVSKSFASGAARVAINDAKRSTSDQPKVIQRRTAALLEQMAKARTLPSGANDDAEELATLKQNYADLRVAASLYCDGQQRPRQIRKRL